MHLKSFFAQNWKGRAMITTSTTAIITSITTMGATGLTVALSIAAVVSLIVFLTAKELAGTTSSGSPWRIARFVNVGIVPLIIVFAVILATQIFG